MVLGDNSLGQLGDGTSALRTAPVKVAGGLRFSHIAVGWGFTCAIATDGVAYCWGQGGSGQLGQPAPELCAGGFAQCATTPQALPGRTYTAIAAGVRHVCALDTAGAAWCWGFNFLGEAGSTAYGETVATPRALTATTAFASIGAGDAFTCALTPAGRAYCWGAADRGELGRSAPACNSVAGFVNTCSAIPVAANTTATFTMLSVGSNSHSCGLTAAGVAVCWGDNGQAQLGTGEDGSPGPAVAQQGMTFTTIDASGAATCGTPTAGASVCWGLNLFGKLGIGTRLDLSPAPLAIAGGRRFATFAGGAQYVCALTAEGMVYCWGTGRDGQLGTGPMLP